MIYLNGHFGDDQRCICFETVHLFLCLLQLSVVRYGIVGLVSHSTHFGDDFMGQLIQPAVSQH